MWQNAASYIAAAGGSCGIHLRELEEGGGELTLFYDERPGPAVRAQFETYVDRHLQQRALPGSVDHKVDQDLPSLRHTSCPMTSSGAG